MNSSLRDARVWITGASSGIGRACAIEFARRGARVALSARSAEALEELARDLGPARAIAAPIDVTNKAANHAAVRRIQEAWGGLDIAFLNAGTCEYINNAQIDAAVFERQISANFLSMVYGVEAALPALRRSPAPHLVGMSSASVYGALPRAEAYGASKAALTYFLEALRIDLLGEGIPVSVVFPGFVRTPLTDKNDFPMPFRIEAERAAEIIVSRLERQPRTSHRIRFPLAFSLILRALTSLPEFVYTPLMARLTRKR